jgi:cytochrome c peroxidase
MILYHTLFVLVLCMTVVPASFAGSGKILSGETVYQAEYQFQLPLGLPAEHFTVPENNPLNEEKVELGRVLFFDKRLSADGTISCATCHLPQLAFTDGRQQSQGIGGLTGLRNAPTLINRAFANKQFWDGRAASLEEQVKGPLISPTEMGMASHTIVVSRIAAITDYRKWFKKVFRSEISIDNLTKAIAAFERILLSGNTKYDRFKAGDPQALSASEQRGLELFEGKARCNQCHSGFNFTDEEYHNIGVGWDKQRIDLGRYSVTSLQQDIGAFKTPTLREVARTAPYMHDGSMANLDEVIEFYDEGGIANPFLDSEMRRLKLTMEQVLDLYDKKTPTDTPPKQSVIKLDLTEQDKADLAAFLKALNGKGWQHIKPPEQLPQ